MAFTDYGPGDCATWAPCTGHPCDPRTDDEDFADFEESVSYAEALSPSTIDSILFNLRHGSQDDARNELDSALRAAYEREAA